MRLPTLLLTGALSVYGVYGHKECRQCQDCTVIWSTGGSYQDYGTAVVAIAAFMAQCATGKDYTALNVVAHAHEGNCNPKDPELCIHWQASDIKIWRLCGNGASYTSPCHNVGDGHAILSCKKCHKSVECGGKCHCDYCGCGQGFDQFKVDLCVP